MPRPKGHLIPQGPYSGPTNRFLSPPLSFHHAGVTCSYDDAPGSLEFLLNCSLLTWVFALECCLIVALNQQWVGLLGVLFLFAVGYGMYSAALPVAQIYADLVRSVIDRFRLSLLQAMGVSLPISLEQERYLWQRFNRFLLFGNLFDYPTSFSPTGD
jgi:hypothetical protein